MAIKEFGTRNGCSKDCDMDHFISLYRKLLNLQDAHFSQIEHEETLVAVVFKVTKPDGLSLILKICSRKDDYLREVFFLNHFAGKLLVPRIVQLVQPAPNIDGAILMEYLPGDLLKPQNLNAQLTYEIGSLLARIHLNRVKGYGDLTQPDHLSSDPRVPITMKFKEGLEECKGHLPEILIEKCRGYLEKHLELLASVDGPCMIHRDFRPGNLIVNHGKLQGIIDWSSGRGGFAEEDFCPLEFGEWSDNPVYKNDFLAGYASVRQIPDYHRILPLLRLNRAVGAIGFTVKRGTWQSKGAQIYQFNRKFLETLFLS